jgi:hypothetical protein
MFTFHSELFDARATAQEALAAKGFDWLVHFTAIDLLHDLYGLEVAGIPEEADANRILELLKETFPDWPHTRWYYQDFDRDRGWKVEIFQHAEQDGNGNAA